MDLVGVLMGLCGCGIVAAWMAIGRASRRPAVPAPKHRAVTPKGILEMPQSEADPAVFADLVSRWIAETSPAPAAPRVRRRGFGTHLAALPPRRRVWSPFVYRTMWAGLHR